MSSLSTTKVASLGLDFHFPLPLEILAVYLLSKQKNDSKVMVFD